MRIISTTWWKSVGAEDVLKFSLREGLARETKLNLRWLSYHRARFSHTVKLCSEVREKQFV